MTQEQVSEICRRRAFPFQSDEVERVETHISWVLLTPDYAYKIKKPIKYSFLDFSTLEKRRYYCCRELLLNARLTEGMYLDVLPVIETEEGPEIRGQNDEHAIIDYVLLMRRMDESKQMNLLLAHRQVTRQHLWQIARQVAAFHRNAEIFPGAEQAGQLDEKFADLLSVEGFVAETLGKASARDVRNAVAFAGRFLDRHARHLHHRNQVGWVVDGHGDLHSKNIFLLEKPVIFDCIEFNDDYRRLDVLNEIAFFCMDLDYYGFPRQAECFLQDYLNRIDCMRTEADRKLFLFYKAYRANVRLKVNCLRAMQPESEAAYRKTMNSVRAYLDLLNSYLAQLQ
jgi:aminoglycoside phosphotransferase family enzyme